MDRAIIGFYIAIILYNYNDIMPTIFISICTDIL